MATASGGGSMARSRRPKRHERNNVSLQDLGLRLFFLGLSFLIAPAFFGASSILKMVSVGLSLPGWLFLAIGSVMLGISHFRKRDGTIMSTTSQKSPSVPMTVREKQDLVENIFRHAPIKAKNSTHAVAPPEVRFGRNSIKVPDINFGREVDCRDESPVKSQQWNAAVFAAIEWRRFEAVCETLFMQAGFKTQSQSHGADGGVDIWLHSSNAQGPVAVVQCKHWNGKTVGVKEMREFFGVMASHHLKRGTYATTSTYTVDAKKFAKENGINALDGAALLSLIAKRTPEQQQALLAVAHEGEYWRPTCASCGIKLVERTPAKGGVAFWGCSNYPGCRTRMQMAVVA
jgi:restriction system protein